MARLTGRDLRKLQECIREIYSDLNLETFPMSMLAAMAKVFPALSIGYAEIDISKRALLRSVVTPFISVSAGEVAAFETYMHEHPLASIMYPKLFKANQPFDEEIKRFKTSHRIACSGDLEGKVVKVHDILTRSQFQSLGIYNEFCRKFDIEFQMGVYLDGGPSIAKNLVVHRDRRDFTEEERLILNLLAPHITQAYKNVETYEEARQTFAALERSKQPLKAYRLTYREEDVLYWVAQGKTNGETAGILKIAPGTVKIHLENIYQKLGVENRTAASALAVGIIDNRKK